MDIHQKGRLISWHSFENDDTSRTRCEEYKYRRKYPENSARWVCPPPTISSYKKLYA